MAFLLESLTSLKIKTVRIISYSWHGNFAWNFLEQKITLLSVWWNLATYLLDWILGMPWSYHTFESRNVFTFQATSCPSPSSAAGTWIWNQRLDRWEKFRPYYVIKYDRHMAKIEIPWQIQKEVGNIGVFSHKWVTQMDAWESSFRQSLNF